jgi:3-methyladenine DNA glycosylase Tag
VTIPFKTIRTRAEKRKGGPKALNKLLPPAPNPRALAKLGDDRVLAEMTRRVFCAGFAWSVIEAKWDGFEKAFLKFEPGRLSLQPDEFWDDLMKDTRVVRNGAKIMSVRANASFVRDVRKNMAASANCWRSGHPPTRSDCSNFSPGAAAGSAAIPARCFCVLSAGTVL